MWQYNYGCPNELYHHGVLGMKWGHRKSPEVTSARNNYQRAKQAQRDVYRSTFGRTAFGGAGITRINNYNSAMKSRAKADINTMNAKAKYNAAKSKDSEKAEFNTYRRAMQKSGLAGSELDINNGGRSTAIYNELKVKKGKAYADRVQKKVQNVAVTELVASGVVALGSMAAQAYLLNKNY